VTLARRPVIFGIVNVTSDSFSDGGKFLHPDNAVAHARALLAHGADVLDLGAAASNPSADRIPTEVEIERLKPLFSVGLDRKKLSIDTFSVEVQRWALDQGVGWLNDIQGFPEPSLYGRLAASNANLIVMHNIAGQGIAQIRDTRPETIFDELEAFFDQRVLALTNAGVARQRLVLDPGMGHFLGKDPEVSLSVLRGLDRLKRRYNLPLMISVSRKSFLRNLAGVGVEAAGPATLSAELFAVHQGVEFLRTHDASALRQALDVWEALDTRRVTFD
jgi:dihydropteroate synthase type 2